MPFVIDEVVINVEVAPGPTAPQAGAGAGTGVGTGAGAADRQALVAEVVEQVLDILQRRQEP
ncbi:MAG: DUF5908 family protein [Rubrivivax sp.]|nr:DUF5908 family protein [Rubrivivax sp.]